MARSFVNIYLTLQGMTNIEIIHGPFQYLADHDPLLLQRRNRRRYSLRRCQRSTKRGRA